MYIQFHVFILFYLFSRFGHQTHQDYILLDVKFLSIYPLTFFLATIDIFLEEKCYVDNLLIVQHHINILYKYYFIF